jgi:ketosteroid isomerase-like protein
MSDRKGGAFASLQRAFAAFERAFTQELATELAELFSADARLMWPGVEDIVGREAIRAALGEFFRETTTLSFLPDRQVIELCGNKAFTIGRFIEDLAPRAGGPALRVHGRLVELWSQMDNGSWQISILLTGRYAENETLQQPSDAK